MHPRLRFWLIVSLGIAASVAAAYQLANESTALATLLALGIAWLVLEWAGGARPEAWALAAALFGYIVANRGFAQLLLTQQFPLLPAEAALAAGLAATVLRTILRQTVAGWRDALNFAVILWILLGSARLWPDVRTHGAVALRDFATIYYALFFFVAQGLALHPPSTRLLRRTLLAAFALLPFTFYIYTRHGEILQRFTFRGAPLVFYKDDLIAAYLFAGFFLVMTVPRWPIWLRLALTAASFAMALSINSSRAAIVGLVTTSAWWAVARQWRPLQWQATLATAGVVGLALAAVVDREPIERSRLFQYYEHFVSMVDVSGTRSYVHENRFYVGDNNRFRLVWWQAVADETWETSPAFGLGFGHDLSARFLRTYQVDLGEDFNTRSPHSIIFTVLGRMGVVGLLAWLGIMVAMIIRTLHLARLARASTDVLPALGWWSVAWVLLASACFGVVLEGPMGAVVFWTTLGLANATTALAEKEPAPAAESALSPATEVHASATTLSPSPKSPA